MTFDPKAAVDNAQTLMLDMDGTILDLAFDNYVWKELVIGRYAEHHGLEYRTARDRLFAKFIALQGNLEWYCLDHWTERLGFDVLELHREVGDRIQFLPGAKEFLEAVSARDVNVLLVTNSHPDTLQLKEERLGFLGYFDGIYSSHSYGHAKETQQFWQALHDDAGFDPATSVFVDDTVTVLRSAAEFGVATSIVVTHPDTSEAVRENGEFPGVVGVREFL